ncbi:MAG: hypothetical protein SHS37scaffold296_14 [Burkholderiales phage 68_11]|jgi:hypothetical protein|nr:MAG: hypothetical protein SHS37scaffold296_14 [Burkholderiales phage 68_11]
MLFHHETTSDEHIAVAHHRVANAAISRDLASFVIDLDSWPSEAARLDGRAPAARFRVEALAAGLPLASGLTAAIEAAVLASAAFQGATPIPDDAGGLGAAQTRKWAEVKAERTARLAGRFGWGGHDFDVDPVMLTGAAVDALLAEQAGETYQQPWVLADNSVIALTAAQQIEVGRACKAHIAELWAISQQLRAEIAAATTLEDLATIHWPT